MHLNYFALQHFSEALNWRLKECTFINAFSLSKEEIYFSFLTPENTELFLSAHFINKNCYFQFSENYNRPKRNFLYQFEESNGGIVKQVVQINFDRSFYIQLKTGFKLLFKLHGGFSNILLINPENETDDYFRKEFTSDASLKIDSLQKNIDLNILLSDKIKDYPSIKKVIPLFDNNILVFLEKQKFLDLSIDKRKKIIDEYFSSNPVKFYLVPAGSKSHLQIFPSESATAFDDALEAYTQLARRVLPSYQMENLKSVIARQINSKIQKIEKQINSTAKHLEISSSYSDYENLGHIIMANMHVVPKKISQIELFDFYKNKNVEVRLDKNLNAQENAEKYYRKAKTLKQDLSTIQQTLNDLNNKLEQIKTLQENLLSISDFKKLKLFATANNFLKPNEEETVFPFRKMSIDNFEVWIGKNASNNDLLTFSYAHKNDIWMHAKDVSGSHVIIRNQAGKIITKPTIEKAAAIAAYYSKSKSQSLAVVQYTIRKFVVKSKGRNSGEVSLLSEQTVMVKPGI